MANERLISKGKAHSIPTVAQLGRVAVGNASAHQEKLGAAGWTEANTGELEAEVAALLEEDAAKVGARIDAHELVVREEAARLEIKSLVRKVGGAVKILCRDGAVEGLTPEHFAVGDQMRGTPLMLNYLERTIPLAARLDAHLARFFGGSKVSELMSQARTRLAQADTAQETARAALPADTAAVLERKGRILDMVDELNAIARIAFDGQAEICAKFNKDLLLRAVRTRAKEVPSPAAPV